MIDLRLAELIAPLSQVTDLGLGQPPETAMRSCLLAAGLARRMNLPEREVGDIYYVTLLQHVGCSAYAHETAALLGGDDITFHAEAGGVDFASPRERLTFLLMGIARNTSPPVRARAVFNMMRAGSSFPQALFQSDCEVAVRIADRLGLSANVQRGLNQVYERWDGKGEPNRVSRDDIAQPSRFAQVAGQAELFDRLGGSDAAIETIRRRAGSAFDPAIAETWATHGRALLTELSAIDVATAIIDAEPEPHLRVPDGQLDTVARTFADTVDLKSPWTHGHSAGVAQLAASAASALGLHEADVATIRQAALLHDLGKAGLPNGILDKPGPLTTTEWEQVQLHPYHSERILSRSPALAPLAPLAGMHHERLDGSGYFRRYPATMLPLNARLLAAANMYQALTQERSWRPALPAAAAARELQREATAGRLDPDMVHAVLSVAGHASSSPRRGWPADLTDREVQVLQMAARGRSNKEIGAALFISPKTADHHIQHIYAKISVSTRAGAAIFAMEHDLINVHIPDK